MVSNNAHSFARSIPTFATEEDFRDYFNGILEVHGNKVSDVKSVVECLRNFCDFCDEIVEKKTKKGE